MIILETRQELLKLVPWNAVIAELGVFTGAFSTEILRICEPAELHLIDIWEGRMQSGDQNGENIQVIEDMSLVYLALALRGDKRYTLHRATTLDALATFPDYYFDFIYVDADHSEAAVYKDLVMAAQKSLWGIGGHDYCPQFDGVVRAVDMFCSDWGWEMTHITRDGCPSYLLRPRQ